MYSRGGLIPRSKHRARENTDHPLNTQLSAYNSLSALTADDGRQRTMQQMAAGYESPSDVGITIGEETFSSPQKAELAKHPNTPALASAWARDAELSEPERVNRNPRRTSAQLRQDMQERDAFFLSVKQLPAIAEADPFHGAGSAGIHPSSFAQVALDSQVQPSFAAVVALLFPQPPYDSCPH